LGEQVLHTGTEAIQIHHSVNHHWCTAGHLLRRDLHLPEELAGPQKQVPKDELSRVRRELHRQAGVEFHFTGPLQCFCQQERVNKMPSSTNYKLLGMRGNVIYDGPICQQYFSDILMSKVMGQSIAFIIIAVNIILKIVIIQLVIWIGEDTTSQQKSSITNKVFLA
jgi:hypothetical protein